MPVGEFAESDMDDEEWILINDDEKVGGAGVGIDLGMQWKFGIQSVNGLGIILSVDGMVNRLNSDINEWMEDYIDDAEDEYDDFELKTPKYFNFPVLVGVNYTHALNENIGLFGEAAMGFNIRKITKLYEHYEMDDSYTYYNGYSYSTIEYTYKRTYTYNYDMSSTFAFRIGGGLVFNNRFTLGLSYWNLGSARIKGKYESERTSYNGDAVVTTKDKDKFKLKSLTPTMVMLRFGISF